jgi:hypothetical protein
MTFEDDSEGMAKKKELGCAKKTTCAVVTVRLLLV